MKSELQDDMDVMDIPSTPITPSDKDENKYTNSGWKFYLAIRSKLNTYWQEFNSEIDKKGKCKYRSVRKFIDSKFKKSEQRDLFYTMVCSYEEWELLASVDYGKSAKKVIPWLGDWEKRRKNGYWQEPNAVYIKSLKKAIKDNLDSSAAIKASAPFLIKQWLLYDKLQGKVLEAFGGEPFLDQAADSPANKKRFEVYLSMISKLTDMQVKISHEWMRIHGVNPNEPNQMMNMSAIAQQFGQIGAAGALTGMAAAQSGIMLTTPGGPPTVISRDALLLAEHYVNHSKDFPDVPETKVEVFTPGKEKTKTNGKHSTQ